MGLKTTFAALALAIGLAQGASAATTTIDFSNGATGSFFSNGSGTYTASASAGPFALGVGLGLPATVSVGGAGLGVSSIFGSAPLIDPDLLAFEMLTVDFSLAFRMISFTLVNIDRNDDFLVSINGGAFTQYGPGLAAGPFTIAVNSAVQSLRILAVGGDADDVGGTIRNPRYTRDSFRLASAAVVPLPAAGLMLLAGLGGLAALRRRKAAV